MTDRKAQVLETIASIVVAPLWFAWFLLTDPYHAAASFQEWKDRRDDAKRPPRRERTRGE